MEISTYCLPTFVKQLILERRRGVIILDIFKQSTKSISSQTSAAIQPRTSLPKCLTISAYKVIMYENNQTLKVLRRIFLRRRACRFWARTLASRPSQSWTARAFINPPTCRSSGKTRNESSGSLATEAPPLRTEGGP